MVSVVSIKIIRAEGPIALCGIEHEFKTFEEANTWLWSQSHTFSECGCDKHDFTIEWDDGKIYGGTLDCSHFSCPDNDLDVIKHVIEYAKTHTGLYRPAHLSEEKYNNYIDCLEKYNPGMKEAYKTLYEMRLKQYEKI